MPIEILMPALSPTMTEGTLSNWLKQEGDQVEAGEVIAEIETDKATMEVEAVDEGVLGKVIISAGTENVKVNEVIALLLEEGEDKSVLDNYKIKEVAKAETKAPDPKENKEETKAAPKAPVAPISKPQPLPENIRQVEVSHANVTASPVAKRIASKNNVSLNQVKGTGPRGRVVKQDIQEFLAASSNNVINRNAEEVIAIKNNNIRKVIASRLLEAKQTIPHFYLNLDCNLDNLLNIRSQINANAPVDEHEKPLYKISVNDFMIKASALALRDVPAANASWSDEAIIRYNNIDVSVAVAIEDGLITPIIKNADQKSVIALSHEMKSLAKKARANKLQPEEFQGGSFSISNLGMYGIKQFNAIVNPPQSCILAVGASEKRAIVADDGAIKARDIVSLTLSCDHRVVDGAIGAEFLTSLKFYLENPATLLM